MYAQLITGALALTSTGLSPPSTGVSPRQATQACPSNPSTILCPDDDGCLSAAANGAVFQVQCTTNLNGRVIKVAQEATFANCVTACSVNTDCDAFNYKSGFCYLLGADIGSPVSASDVNAASEISPPTQASPAPGSSTCTNTIACPQQDGCAYVSSGLTFYARCTVDLYGGDIPGGAAPASGTKACVDRCADTPGCVA
ncbi:hypothetical protein B5807_07311 [Epicoccum nigrum]|uniref:Apple domain-containing protein n=1 Tax=Epicoccum nigrum TaxID=105696 RepID=A0A1Y2LUZ8_EPING|nr:hypothetical protein B5807_07311 [Epicoccum nigrum]